MSERSARFNGFILNTLLVLYNIHRPTYKHVVEVLLIRNLINSNPLKKNNYIYFKLFLKSFVIIYNRFLSERLN